MIPIICVIDGNIGAGKSTLLSKLRQMGYRTYPEPMDEWTTYLDLFYADPKRWSFTLQMAILLSLESQKEKVISETMSTTDSFSSLAFIERSPESSMIFTDVQRDAGFLTDLEYDLIYRMYQKVTYVPDYTFFVDVPPSLCLERIRTRGRLNEKGIDERYLSMLQNRYKTLNMITLNGTLPKLYVIKDLLSKLPRNLIDSNALDAYTNEIQRYKLKYQAYRKAYENIIDSKHHQHHHIPPATATAVATPVATPVAATAVVATVVATPASTVATVATVAVDDDEFSSLEFVI